MKKVIKNPLFTFILGVVLAASFSVYATVSILSSQVDYVPRDSEWDVNNVEAAIDELYEMAKNNGGNSQGFSGTSWTLGYLNNFQRFEIPATGEYRIELWGAAGGSGSLNGKGAYTAGTATFDYGTELFFYIGQMVDGTAAAFNGGGSCVSGCVSGGGATDVRFFGLDIPSEEDLAWNSTIGLNSRVMVAGAGGGYNSYSSGYAGGAAGGITSYSSGGDHPSSGGTQLKGGTGSKYTSAQYGNDGTFGVGGNSANSGWGGGGGSGYYGGGAGSNSPSGNGGAGGSSFISGHAGCVAIKEGSTTEPREVKTEGCTQGTTDVECSKHYSGLYFTDTVMVDGQGYAWTNVKGTKTGMPSYNGSTINGNNGNGYARITFLG